MTPVRQDHLQFNLTQCKSTSGALSGQSSSLPTPRETRHLCQTPLCGLSQHLQYHTDTSTGWQAVGSGSQPNHHCLDFKFPYQQATALRSDVCYLLSSSSSTLQIANPQALLSCRLSLLMTRHCQPFFKLMKWHTGQQWMSSCDGVTKTYVTKTAG